MPDNVCIGDRECFGLSHDDMVCACVPKELRHKYKSMNNDFAVYLHERYNMTKAEMQADMDEILNNPIFSACEPNDYKPRNLYCYEERGSASAIPNIDFSKLFVGARLWYDDAELMSLSVKWEEIEITHIYAGVAFYKYLTGPKAGGQEDYMQQKSLAAYLKVYPKIIYKPKGMNLTCDCPYTQILDYPDEV